MASNATSERGTAVVLAVARRNVDRSTAVTAGEEVLMEITDSAGDYEQTLALDRVAGSVWVTCGTALRLTTEDVSECEVVVVGRLASFPLDGRPFLLLLDLSTLWLSENRRGTGRNMLETIAAYEPGSLCLCPLHREVSLLRTRAAVVGPSSTSFQCPSSTSAYAKLSMAIIESVDRQGNPAEYAQMLITEARLAPKGMAAYSVKNIIFTVYLLAARDRLNVSELAIAEHLSRWCVQVLESHRTDPWQAEYDSPEGYIVHMQEASMGVLRAGKFGDHIVY